MFNKVDIGFLAFLSIFIGCNVYLIKYYSDQLVIKRVYWNDF